MPAKNPHSELTQIPILRTNEALIAELTTIAHTTCGVGTLHTRGSDRLDFHDVGVANLRAALLAAYELGRRSK